MFSFFSHFSRRLKIPMVFFAFSCRIEASDQNWRLVCTNMLWYPWPGHVWMQEQGGCCTTRPRPV